MCSKLNRNLYLMKSSAKGLDCWQWGVYFNCKDLYPTFWSVMHQVLNAANLCTSHPYFLYFPPKKTFNSCLPCTICHRYSSVFFAAVVFLLDLRREQKRKESVEEESWALLKLWFATHMVAWNDMRAWGCLSCLRSLHPIDLIIRFQGNKVWTQCTVPCHSCLKKRIVCDTTTPRENRKLLV